MTEGLTSGEKFLREAAQVFFNDIYGGPDMYLNTELHRNLAWTPALRFIIHDHINVFVEPSETGPYPRILALKNLEVRNFQQPIAIYAVCPENMTSKSDQQLEMKRLEAHGFGLLTVGPNGQARRMFSGTPLVQVIPPGEFKEEIDGLSGKISQRVSEAFDDYNSQPVNGVKSISEVIEGLVTQAGKDAEKKGYLAKNQLRDAIADVLDALHDVEQCKDARAAIGGIRSYINQYRNLSHHWPRNKQKAYEKYANCRHAFLEGIKQLKHFRAAMINGGLSGNLPRG